MSLPNVDYLPDPRFAKFYEKAFEEAIRREGAGQMNRSVEQSFGAGYENFLLRAMYYSYLYGDETQARYYYDKAREKYSQTPENRVSGRYNLTLDDLVMQEAVSAQGQRQATQAFLMGMLQRAFDQGLASPRPDRHARFLRIASAAHEAYNEQFENNANAAMSQERTKLPPMEELYLSVAYAYLTSPVRPLPLRGVVYQRLVPEVRARLYPAVRQVLAGEMEEELFDRYFPAPAAPVDPERGEGGGARGESGAPASLRRE